jgi:hypothetical protein
MRIQFLTEIKGTALVALGSLVLVGCGGAYKEFDPDAEEDPENTTMQDPKPDRADHEGGDSGADSGDGDATESGDSEESGDADGGLRFDLGSSDLPALLNSCDKVDILYVIDNSGSMKVEQKRLIANFETFVAEMQNALEGVDSYHIGVITSDDYLRPDRSKTVNIMVPECRHLGSLVVQGQSGLCTPFANAGNFITEADDLATTFRCIANVGSDGSGQERLGDALVSALLLSQGKQTCNSNFFREDALLVIVMMTDENDSSVTSETQWFDALASLKHDEAHIVVVPLIWDESFPKCKEGRSEDTDERLRTFAQMFTHHKICDICEPSYAQCFSSAIPKIKVACEEFVPE